MNQAQLEALLGRPLTTVEEANTTLYLEIATETLEKLLCTTINPATGSRTFDVREGYRTAYVDIFRTITEVKVDGNVIDTADYSKRQWDHRNGSWYNSLVFKRAFRDSDTEIVVTGEWGFITSPTYDVPADLQAVLAGLFDLITKKNKLNPAVSSKQVEDFRINFVNGVNLTEEFVKTYGETIDKYSLCNIGYTRQGSTC